MAIHNMTDAYAHSAYAYIDNGWQYLNHEGDSYPYADDTSENYGARYECAKKAVGVAMKEYNNKRDGSYGVFCPAVENANEYLNGSKSHKVFKMADIKRFVREVAGSVVAEQFAVIDQTPNYNPK